MIGSRDFQGVCLRALQGEPKQENRAGYPAVLATPAMIITRPILMRSSPPRPLTNQRRLRGGGPDETSEQVTNF